MQQSPARQARAWRTAAVAGVVLLAALPRIHSQVPGTVLEAEFRGAYTPAQIEELGRPLFSGFQPPASRLSVNSYDLKYVSTDFDGSSAVIHAQLFVPVYAAEAERPVLVFGSGTTGIADSCAPSLEQPEVRRWGHYRANMLAYAGAGFITIFPDYLGFNDPDRPQRYFSLKAEGHVMLDAARAARHFLTGGGSSARGTAATPAPTAASQAGPLPTSVRPAPAVFTAGYSQGGHAAFAAADLQREYAPEVPLVGVVGIAATTDVAALMKEGPYYAPYILYTYFRMYGRRVIDPALYLQDRWAATLEADVERMCVDQFQAYYPLEGRQLYRPELYEALHGGDLEGRFPALAAALKENRSGLGGHRLPALVIQGDDDIIVTTKTQDRLVEELLKRGSEVRYLVFPGVRHRYTRPAGFAASLDWMESHFRGLPALEGNRP